MRVMAPLPPIILLLVHKGALSRARVACEHGDARDGRRVARVGRQGQPFERHGKAEHDAQKALGTERGAGAADAAGGRASSPC